MTGKSLTFAIKLDGDSAAVLVTGDEFSLDPGDPLRPQIDQAITSSAGKIVVDLRQVESLNTIGLGLLFSAYFRAQNAGKKLQCVLPADEAMQTVFRDTKTEFLLEE